MSTMEKTIMQELSTLPEEKMADVLTYIRFVKFSLADAAELEKRFDKSWKRVQARAKKLKITQEDIDAEIRAVRAGK